jgi:hypothetical protein
MKTLLISILILTAHLNIYAQQENLLVEAADSKTPGLCYKQTPKCNYRQLTQAEVDTATAMSDEVAYQLKQIDHLERAQNREFKIAIIGRSGTDLGKFQILKDTNSQNQLLNMDQLFSQIKTESEQINMSSDGGTSGQINYQVVRSYFDKDRKMDFSHVAIAMKNHPKSDKNFHWQVMHLLWTCDKDPARNVNEGDRSYIWEEGLGAVFADDMKRYRAQIMVPKQNLQNRLESILLKGKLGANWHNKKYNAAALADDLDQQNSNQWVLEVLAAAIRPEGEVTDRAGAQQVLAKTQFLPTKVTPTGLYRLMTLPLVGNLLPGTVCMKRQKYFGQGFGEIISVLSIEDYMKRNQMLQYEPFIVELSDDFNFVKQEREAKKKP